MAVYKPFMEILLKAGIQKQNAERVIILSENITYEDALQNRNGLLYHGISGSP